MKYEKETLTGITELRSLKTSDIKPENISQLNSKLDKVASGINVTLDDYKLEEQLLLEAYETRQTISYIDNETGRRVLLNQKTYTNNKDSTVSVSEIGWLVYNRILIYREVLDNPISLLPSESVTISLKRFLN